MFSKARLVIFISLMWSGAIPVLVMECPTSDYAQVENAWPTRPLLRRFDAIAPGMPAGIERRRWLEFHRD